MRLLLQLKIPQPFLLSVNYQHYLAAALYRLVSQGSPDHAKWLHDKGFVAGAHRFKLFTFSRLLFKGPVPITGEQILFKGMLEWMISIYAETTLLQLIIGLFENRQFYMGHPANLVLIKSVDILPDPVYRNVMTFSCVSPVLVKKPKEKRNGEKIRLYAEYLMPDHPEIAHYLHKNLLKKFLAAGTASVDPESIQRTEFLPDMQYIQSRGGIEKVSKKIQIRTQNNKIIEVRAFECPFTLKAEPQLIKIAYECGLGENNAMGFGMIKLLSDLQA